MAGPTQLNLDRMMQTETAEESDSPGTRPDVLVSIPEPAWTNALADVSSHSTKITTLAYQVGTDYLGAALPAPEISILLTNDAEVMALNLEHRDKAGPTNVLSFPALTADQIESSVFGGVEHPILLGDVVLAFETVDAEAARANKPLADHLAHLLVHGILHLLGFDHATDGTAHRMETLEVDILRRLGVGDPYVVD